MGIRTFLAVDTDEAIIRRLEETQKQFDQELHGAKFNWVGRENLHMTLVFLGDVPDEMINEVCTIAAGAADEVEPFEIEVVGLTATPPHGQPRMLWAEVIDPTGRLELLQTHLAEGLSVLGLRQEERRFKAHITLARIKYMPDWKQFRLLTSQLADEEFGIQAVDDVVIYSSQLTREGPIYTPLARVPIGR